MSSQTTPPREHGGGSSIPEPLRNRSQWIVTGHKRPVTPNKGWPDPDNQFSFGRAQRLAHDPHLEPAYVLQADDPYVVIDLDDVGPEDPTKVTEEAGGIVQRLDTYTEVSRSKTGLHMVCEGTRLPDRCETGDLHEAGHIEVFDANRYVVLTGNRIDPYDTIKDGHNIGPDDEDVLVELQREYLPTRSDSTESDTESSFDLESVSRESTSVRVEDVRRTMEEYSKGGSSKARRAFDRWDSPAGSDCGFPSPSEADLAFVSDLAFWCREDARLIDDCFRASNRMREKWDTVHYADGRTYGEGTIQTAVRTNYHTFDGHYVQHR